MVTSRVPDFPDSGVETTGGLLGVLGAAGGLILF